MKLFAFAFLTACAVALAGCRDSQKPHGHDHADQQGHDHDHAHAPPHGGTPVTIADHKFVLELVRDAAEGKMTAYILDGHMEKAAPVSENRFSLVVKLDGQEELLSFSRVENSADPSAPFEARADWIKSSARFQGVIPSITIQDETFTNISITFPKGTSHAH
jgi:hypothetical protein